MSEDSKRTDQLAQIAELIVTGCVQVHVETILPLRDARRAQELSQGGHARGKIVLAVESDPGMVL